MPRSMLLLTAALLAAPGEARAEEWPTLEKYIDWCSLIVKAKTVERADGGFTFEVIETWKGRYDPKRFVDVTKEGRFFASGHGECAGETKRSGS